ncbi:hypothetical protein G9A89_012376 [Geosiphon pyriformis]|nr:hypothetical protein G9A89_012376 [Geosiphon pyriformis]
MSSFVGKKAKLSKVNDEEKKKSYETFVFYGTELPETVTGDLPDAGKFQPVWKQEVRDENGLRRFHGAFKGGWSAGYYNTVGSKEGWTPSSFVSSRSSRSGKKSLLPQDFMDEEDLEDLGQNQQLVMTEQFDSLGSTERESSRKNALLKAMSESRSVLKGLPEMLVNDLIVPNNESVGMLLLKKMGWREGQGIGPRIQKKNSQNQDHSESDDEIYPSGVSFPPKDNAMITFDQKNNTFGLGFNPYENAPEFAVKAQSDRSSSYPQPPIGIHSLPIKGGIRVGVLEEDEEDYIYGDTSILDPRSSLLDESEEAIIMGKNQVKKQNPVGKSSVLEKSSALICYDGSIALEGFELAQKPVPLNKWFPPPEIPTGYKPIHLFNSLVLNDNLQSSSQSYKDTRPKITNLAALADQRGVALGENFSQAPARSVFDFVSRKDKARLDNIIGGLKDTKPASMETLKSSIPKIEKDVALAALKGFIPFGDNLKRQARYKRFLEGHAGLSLQESIIPEGFTEDEFVKELNDFAKAARIFRPMSSMIASRFTSASPMSIVQEFKQPEGGLKVPSEIKSSEIAQPSHGTSVMTGTDSNSSAEAAARMNMFGALTRTRKEFYPNRLLCKRFNVANPYPEQPESNTGKTQKGQRQALSKEQMDEILQESNPGLFTKTTDAINKDADIKPKEKDSIAAETPQPDTAEDAPIDYTRPSMDIFKAIFESESVADSEEDASAPKASTNMINQPTEYMPKQTESLLVSKTEPKIPFRPVFTKKSDRKTDKMILASSTKPSNEQSNDIPKIEDHVSAGPLSFLDDIQTMESSRKRTLPSRDQSSDTNYELTHQDINKNRESKPTSKGSTEGSDVGDKRSSSFHVESSSLKRHKIADLESDEPQISNLGSHQKRSYNDDWHSSSNSKKHKGGEGSGSDESKSDDSLTRRHRKNSSSKRHKKKKHSHTSSRSSKKSKIFFHKQLNIDDTKNRGEIKRNESTRDEVRSDQLQKSKKQPFDHAEIHSAQDRQQQKTKNSEKPHLSSNSTEVSLLHKYLYLGASKIRV